jgi:tetratricopeptide (TPR) repeat protein
MPTTVNGIGTTYFGKRNRRQFQGTCQHCHYQGQLENYETWLVVSVFFIPVLPLGKKQILNKCPKCTRHASIAYSAWLQAQKEAVEASAAELARNSHDPDAAIRMHATYDAYQLHDDAARFADAMMALYGDVARVQFYLAAWYERLGRKEQAEAAFDAAYRLEPANVLYQRAVAIGHIEHGRLEEAQRMLVSFKPPSPSFEPQLFFLLANAFHAQGRDEQAMEQFKLLIDTRPDLLKDRSFRKAVRRTEKALGAESVVGREPLYRSRAVLVALAAAAVLLAFFGVHWYMHHHRNVYVVNGLPAPLNVKIDEATMVNVPAQGHALLALAEGPHTALVQQPDVGLPRLDFELTSHWFTGTFSSPAYVIDPSRSAAVAYEEVSYAPAGQNAPPGQHHWHVGEPFNTFSVDYAFAPFPQQLQVKGNHPLRKSRIDQIPLTSMQVFMLLSTSPNAAEKILPWAETYLRLSPDDQMVLFAYLHTATKQRQLERCKEFLATRLAERPVRVDWHRAWQNLRREENDDDAVIKQYDDWLAADPGNSALLYLRGRCDRDMQTALDYYERAMAADANNAYPRYAASIIWLGRGELKRAREAAEEAARLKPNDLQMKHSLNLVRFALGQYEELEQDLRGSLAAEPLAVANQEPLLSALVAQGKPDEAAKQVDAFQQQAAAQAPQQAAQWARQLRHALLYMQGKFDELSADAATPPVDNEAQIAKFQAQFELGQTIEPPAGLSPVAENEEAYLHLCQSVALSERGDQAAARTMRATAIEILQHGTRDQRDVAAVLNNSSALSQNDLDHLPYEPRLRAIVLVAIVDASKDRDLHLLDLAETLNFDRRFPYYFLRRVIGRLR